MNSLIGTSCREGPESFHLRVGGRSFHIAGPQYFKDWLLLTDLKPGKLKNIELLVCALDALSCFSKMSTRGRGAVFNDILCIILETSKWKIWLTLRILFSCIMFLTLSRGPRKNIFS